MAQRMGRSSSWPTLSIPMEMTAVVTRQLGPENFLKVMEEKAPLIPWEERAPMMMGAEAQTHCIQVREEEDQQIPMDQEKTQVILLDQGKTPMIQTLPAKVQWTPKVPENHHKSQKDPVQEVEGEPMA